MYPNLLIDINKLKHNARSINDLLIKNNISSRFLVVKMLAGHKSIIKELSSTGFTHLADSRIKNLKAIKGINLPKVLLRIPAFSEIKDVVKYADISLNSEILSIIKLNNEAIKQNKVHNIILMFDLGDLREGIFFKDEYINIIEIIIKLAGIKLIGIGTNLTCYGGVIPTPDILNILVNIKKEIESKFKLNLEIISGGNSSTIPLLLNNKLPMQINNLRLGEVVVLARETSYGQIVTDLYDDVFTLQAEIIELKEKPSYPLGELGMDSFGEIPKIIDKGIMNRGILALGKQDIILDNLQPIDKNIKVIGGSSDHLICDFSSTDYNLGDIINFKINYPGLLQLMTSKYVNKTIIQNSV